MKSKKYLVSGGSGFIGSHIVEKLINQNHKVIVIDNNSNERNPIIFSKAKYHDFDISHSKNINEIVKLLKGCFGVFHCAALIDVQESIKEPFKYENNNTMSTLNLLEATRKAGVKNFVYSSSAAVYGDTIRMPINEDFNIKPISPYGAQKYYGEVMCKVFSKLHGMNTSCLRYFNVFGERQKVAGAYATVIGIFKHQISQNKPLTIRGDGNQRRDFIYVKDIANANIQAMNSKESFIGEIFNIGYGKSYSINEIANFFNTEKVFIDGVKEPKESLANIKKSQDILKWNPSINVEDWIKTQLTNF